MERPLTAMKELNGLQIRSAVEDNDFTVAETMICTLGGGRGAGSAPHSENDELAGFCLLI